MNKTVANDDGARVLVAGKASGAPMMIEPLSFWGGFDSESGKIIDRFHPHFGQALSGRILFMERGRGSSSGASVLAEAIRLGTAPAAICLTNSDAIITIGALVAHRLYQRPCPVIVFDDREKWSALARANHLEIEAFEVGARILQG